MLETIQYDENLSVKVQLLDIRNYPIHNHKDFQIFYVLEGELSLKLFYSLYRLCPGDIHIIHSEDVHSIKSITDRNRVLVLTFDSEYFKSIFPHFITTVFITNIEEGAFKKRDALCNEIFAIAAETCDKSPGYVSRVNNSAVSLINTLMKNFRGFVIDPNHRAFVHKASHDYVQVDRISRIISYVYENYPYKLRLAEIAESEQISPYYLSHMFSKLVGLNFRDFLSMVRVEMSQSRILSTDKSISQIAHDVGFSDAKYYVENFHDYMGYHPKEYRRLYAKKTLGYEKPDQTEIPLSELQPLIDKYLRGDGYDRKKSFSLRVETDFNFTASKKIYWPKTAPSAIGDSPLFLKEVPDGGQDYSELYQNISPQKVPVEILCDISRNPTDFSFTELTLIDTPKSLKGLFTINGLYKPVFYLIELMQSFPENLADSGNAYISLCSDTEKHLILFNDNASKSITIDVVIRNIPSGCKLTKYSLHADRSYMYFWAQLNLSSHLSSEDIKNINSMTRPAIEFETIPPMEQYYTSINLSPHDITVMKFSRF
jgi:AraC-like DNA-binding protein